MLKKCSIIVVLIVFQNVSFSQKLRDNEPKIDSVAKLSTKWYDKLTIRGYAQARYNGLLQTNPDLECEQCDRSWGGESSFFLRRIRIIFFGQINPRIYFYIQPDFASSASSTGLHFAQIRDAYFDVGIDKKSEFRFRIGQSKIPFGFENMQSSQNRLALDRTDALNSAVSNERDLGVMFYWASTRRRELFSELVKSGLKGSGDYGVLGIGVYNGQTANRPELNDNKHFVARAAYPFQFKNQIMELGVQGYKGLWEMPSGNLTKDVKVAEDKNYRDERIAGSFILYPKPFGLQAEYNLGVGPEYNSISDSIETKPIKGGYVLVNYQFKVKEQLVIPFVRYHVYKGGKKHELDARSHSVEEIEFGIEWQPLKHFELVCMYTMSSRRFEDSSKPNNYQRGNLLRIQAQVNF
jgi:hypothetical protein